MDAQILVSEMLQIDAQAKGDEESTLVAIVVEANVPRASDASCATPSSTCTGYWLRLACRRLCNSLNANFISYPAR